MAASGRIVVAAALASALLLWAASPAVGVGPLAWIALVPVASVALATGAPHPGASGRLRASPRARRLAVPLAYLLYLELLLVPAFPFGLAEGQWGDPVLPVLVGDSPVLAIALLAAPLLAALLYLARFGEPWGVRLVPAPLAAVALVAAPALAWTALDFVRAKLDPGALWGPLFLSQSDQATASLAALAGPWLVTLAIAAVNYGIAAALVRRRAAYALAPLLIAALLVVVGLAREIDRDDGPAVRVAAVQPGYDTAERERPELRHFRRGTYDLAALDLIRDLGELTEEAAAEGASLVVWPEASMYVDPRREPEVRRALGRASERSGTALVVPFFRPRPEAEGATLVVTSTGAGTELSPARPKHRPLWFLGERRADGETTPIELDGIAIGTLLGTDTQDARNAAALAADGARMLASSTHDWRESAVPATAHAQVSARAAGVPLVRADWRYGSAIYARGEVLADAGPDRTRTAVVADIGLGDPASAYATLGDIVGWVAVGFAVAVALIAAVARLSRGGGRGGDDRAPPRGPRRPRPSPAPPPAGDGQSWPPP